MTESPTTSVGAGLSRTMTRGSEELIQQIHAFLQSHPKEAASLGIGPAAAPPPAPPAHATAGEAHPRRERSTRSLWRRSFYTAVVAGLAMLAINVTHLAYLEHTTRGAQELVVEEVRQNRGWLGRVVVVQALIITFNVILTYRGVKVWSMPLSASLSPCSRLAPRRARDANDAAVTQALPLPPPPGTPACSCRALSVRSPTCTYRPACAPPLVRIVRF